LGKESGTLASLKLALGGSMGRLQKSDDFSESAKTFKISPLRGKSDLKTGDFSLE
jgi:hypothetical protein